MNQMFAVLLIGAAILSAIAPEQSYSLGEARIISVILFVGGAIIWCMPRNTELTSAPENSGADAPPREWTWR